MEKFFSWMFLPRSERKKATRAEIITAFLHDAALSTFIFMAALLVTDALSKFTDTNHFAIAVFILAVALIARGTHGYFWGIAGSILSVISVNVVFSYPYWRFDLSVTDYPLTFAAMLAVSLIISTLTSRLKTQEEMRLALEVEKMRATLLRSVSHDLRTPLTSIVGSSSVLLENDSLPPELQRELLSEINKDARWLARVTENILSITRFSNGRVLLRKEDEVIEEVVASAIVKFHRTHPEIAVAVERPEEILLAPMDATLIEQVMQNLFHNAANHGEHVKNIQVIIKRNNNMAQVSVADDGAGFSDEMLQKLFDGQRFSRSDDGRNMGIGLAVCNTIIRAHGGSIVAKNGDNGGARITFRLPLPKEGEEVHAL